MEVMEVAIDLDNGDVDDVVVDDDDDDDDDDDNENARHLARMWIFRALYQQNFKMVLKD